MSSLRHFKVPEGRALVLPQGLYPGPGATNMRLDPGDIITLDMDDARTRRHQRFMAILIKDGDLVSVDHSATEPGRTACASSSSPPTAKQPFVVNRPIDGGK